MGADSVFSSPVPSTHSASSNATTALGERQGDVGPGHLRYMSEEGLKISVGNDTVVGFAGHVDTARTVVRMYFDGRMSGLGAREAVNAALVSVSPCEQEAEVLFAFYEAEAPCLLLINTLNCSCCDVEGLVQLGSELPAGQHKWTAEFATSFSNRLDQLDSHPLYVERIFTSLVALLQSYGVHDYLLPHGVGGAFVAAWVTPTGARWQGNHLYVIHGERPAFEDPMCATTVHSDVVCLINNQTDSTKLLTWTRLDESQSDRKARIESAAGACVEAWDCGGFDYFVSLNNTKHIVTVVEMCGHQHHSLVSLHASHVDRRLGIVWTQQLITSTNTIAGVEEPDPEHMTLWFFPFIEISDEQQREREQFAWECFVDWNGEPGNAGVSR